MFKQVTTLIALVAFLSVTVGAVTSEVYKVEYRTLGSKKFFAVTNLTADSIVCTQEYVNRKASILRKFRVPPKSTTIWKPRPKDTVVVCRRL